METDLMALLQRALMASVPLLTATLGEILAEKAGVLNLGIEGMMAAGAVVSFATAFATGSLPLAILAGVLAAVLMAALHGAVSLYLGANQTVSGLALTMIGVGLVGLVGKPYIGLALASKVESFSLPLLSDIPYVGVIFGQLNPFFLMALLLTVGVWIFFNKTKAGLHWIMCGENPQAAQSLGVPVNRLRMIAVMVGGSFSGLAGAYLALSDIGSWSDGVVGGRGWIVIALTILSLWRPYRALVVSILFGGIFILQYTLQPLGIPVSLLAMMPYLVTILVLVVDGLRSDHRRLGAPAALGNFFRKGER